MVMAAGLGTRLRPLTWDVPKPVVPVANRPIMEHVLRLLARQGFHDVVANLHWFPDAIRSRFGDGSSLGLAIEYSHEEELLGTAGGVRNVSDRFTDGPFVVMAADPLTDVDLVDLAEAHRRHGGIATLAVKRVADVSEYGVVITGSDGRIQGFQEKPDPAEALSDLASCMIYVLEPEIFDYFPDKPAVDFALDVFPALLESDVPFHVHETSAYWNDVGSIPEYLQGNLDALDGAVAVDLGGDVVDGSENEESPSEADGGWLHTGRVLLGEGAQIAEGARLDGPVVVGQGACVGAGAQVKSSVILPEAEIAAEAMLVGAIAGRRGRFA
jgi:mannose-1-phosphate guanylyltransferase/mannose-1-phosphate guanylyltransferase/phosphomannomutase